MFVRTVLGDVMASELGACGAHEHVFIDSPQVAAVDPELRLNEVEPAARELADFYAAGGRAMIDTMPGGCGRDLDALAALSRRTGVHVVAATGLHLARYYPPDARETRLSIDAMTGWFVEEITAGCGAVRCGVIKVAGGERLSDPQRRAFIAAARAQRRTGCPIITHTERGRGAMEQVELLRAEGARLDRVTLSHVDRDTDPDHHAALLDTGVRMEYDGAFRWPRGAVNPTVELLRRLMPRYPGQLMVGMDAARRRYWRSYGGEPGLAWLMRDLPVMLRDAGLDNAAIHRIYVDNPAAAFSFIPSSEEPT